MAESRTQRWVRRALNEVVHRGWYQVRRFGAIAPGTAIAERFGSFGEGAIITFPPSTFYGEPSIHIGAGTLINGWSTVAAGYAPDQPDVPPRALVIGERCLIGMRCSIIAHESIEIGDDVWFGQEVFVTDSNHGFDDPDVPIGKQLGTHQPVSIGSGSWIGHGAVILPGSQIGRNVVVAAGSVVRGEVADHTVVGGVPAKVLRPVTTPEHPPGAEAV